MIHLKMHVNCVIDKEFKIVQNALFIIVISSDRIDTMGHKAIEPITDNIFLSINDYEWAGKKKV